MWIVISAALAVSFKYLVYPKIKGKLVGETSSESQYRQEIKIAADSFSGYCFLRSDALQKLFKPAGIKITVVDDQANYEERTRVLMSNKVQMAVYPLDALIKTGTMIGDFPGTVVMVIDETKGADAIVSYKSAVASLEDLNDSKARFVFTPDSPSEFLARIVIAHFNLPDLPKKWWIEAAGAEDVYDQFRKADETKLRAYALWEPYVTKALEKEGAHVLLDSSKLQGYIVDVLVVQREFLKNNTDLVKTVVQNYMKVAYRYSQNEDDMVKLIVDDAKKTGSERLNKKQAKKIIQGIQWKNTLENFAHFGLLSTQDSHGLQHIEDIILNIANVLNNTGAMDTNPLIGKANILYYDTTLKEIQADNFHPARKLDIIKGVGPALPDLNRVRGKTELARLSDEQWNSLVAVGRMNVKPISFGRGTARLNIHSQRELARLAQHLKAWPQYYLLVIGHARAEGDVEANTVLSNQRARMAADSLVGQGIGSTRIRAKAARPSGRGGAAQSVSFIVGQLPY